MFLWNCCFMIVLVNIGLLGIVKNPVMSVIIMVCIIIAISFMVIYGLNLDLMGLILILVYMGAISVIFLFVVMMLNIKIIEMTSIFWGYISISIFYFIIIFYEMSYFFNFEIKMIFHPNWMEDMFFINFVNIELIMFSFYNYQIIWLILLTIILLMAMMGSILLTHKIVMRTKSQNTAEQGLIYGWEFLQLKNLCMY